MRSRRCLQSFLSRLFRAVVHVTMACFILVLPFGYYTQSPDTADAAIGLHAGYGNVATVVRDCEGKALHSESSTFHDVSGSAYAVIGRSQNASYIVGLRGGYWESGAVFASEYSGEDPDYGNSYGATAPYHVTYSYINPNLSLEFKNVGIGLGIMFGNIPGSFSDHQPVPAPGQTPEEMESNMLMMSQEKDDIPISAHLRFGNIEKKHFIASFAENLPLASGGSYFDVGVGYPVGKSARMFTGVSAAFYNQPGFLQQARFRISGSFDGEVAVRLGQAGGELEASISGGLIYRVGLR